jgi:hypothetical protein
LGYVVGFGMILGNLAEILENVCEIVFGRVLGVGFLEA